jgi:hypothetical protein
MLLQKKGQPPKKNIEKRYVKERIVHAIPFDNLWIKGTKRKDPIAVVKGKGDVKRKRQAATSTSTSTSALTCGSCQEEGHSSARSSLCRNHNPKLTDIIQYKLGQHSHRYITSITFKQFCYNTTNTSKSLEKIKTMLALIREALFKAQLFINYFILMYPSNATSAFLHRNFWYSILKKKTIRTK